MSEIKLFEVGGSIRDSKLGIESKDRDFCAVSMGGWDQLVAWSKSNMNKVFLITPQFFTIRGIIGRDPVDIVMCRKDGESTDGRRPDLVEPGSIFDDLKRRDFTVNSMAREVFLDSLSPKGDLIDPFGGASDLKNNILRTVGNTEDRFSEDGLRILRALRFIATKGFCPDTKIKDAMSDSKWWKFMEDTVSIERTREELQKMFKHDTPLALSVISEFVPSNSTKILFSKIWLKPTLEKK
tara:strand:- start:837 stop:1553 length:717 start_codon:yes stop_codon:yes gene_type:complete